MKITAVRLVELTGTFPYEGIFWEERLSRPLDIYPEHHAEEREWWLPEESGPGPYRLREVMLLIETNEGVTGLAGPVQRDVAWAIATQLRPLLLGHDPLASERIWDRLYRAQVHGRKGLTMMAISAVDCALWDLRGRWHGVPVHRLLGGPVRTVLPVYASMLGFSLESARVRERVTALIEQGFSATKWFPRWGPADGREGLRKILTLAETLRDALGPDRDFMLDAWMSWTPEFARAVVHAIAPLRPRWLEEPYLPDQIAEVAALRRQSPVPIALGEHEYTRWGIRHLLEAGAADVLQPDLYWAGGISEGIKIAALTSSYGVPLIPHGHSVPATVQFLAALPEPVAPMVEYLVKWNQLLQWFWDQPVEPQNGVIVVPERPGMGVDIAWEKVEDQRDLSWE